MLFCYNALGGYDIEIGTSLFAFSDSLNDQFGTKVFVARYSFTGRNVKAINGTRFRAEQNLGTMWAGETSYKFHVSAETQFDKIRKRQNFIGLGMKVAFNDKKKSYKKKPTGLKHRMMETVIRDVDIVTESTTEAPTRHSFHMNGKEVSKIYYVGSARAGYSGDGTKSNPMSLEQMNSLNCDDAIIVVTTIDPGKGGTAISRQDYTKIKAMPQVINDKQQVVLSTNGADKVSLIIKDENGISITSGDQKNTKIIIDNDQNISETAPSSTIQLLKPEVTEAVKNQIQVARVAEQEEIAEIAQLAELAELERLDELAELERLAELDELERLAEYLPMAEVDPLALVNEAARRILAEAAGHGGAAIAGEAELVLQPEGTFISGIDRNRLSPAQKELYDLIINCSATLQTHNHDNAFVQRQIQYDLVNEIIVANPHDDLAAIQDRINRNAGIAFADRPTYRALAEKIMRFDGVVGAAAIVGGQQGIGAGHTGPKDVTIAASLERLRAKYGVLDGNNAINLAKRMATRIIQDNVPAIGHNVGDISLRHRATEATAQYKAAAVIYIDNLRAPAGETPQEKVARIERKANARIVIDREVKSSLTAVNKNMAAYRALHRAETAVGGVFTEYVLGRYNDQEMLAYMILANLDVREIQKNLRIANKPLTPSNIFASQKENLQGLINQLGDGQRAYNMDNQYGAIDTGGIRINGVTRPLGDSLSCGHGYCTRIVSSAAMHHSDVNLSEVTPASLGDEFNNAVIQKTKELNPMQKAAIKNWWNRTDVFQANIEIAHDTINFSTPIRDEEIDIPEHYKVILTEVATELDSRYNFTNPNHKLQLVKRVDRGPLNPGAESILRSSAIDVNHDFYAD